MGDLGLNIRISAATHKGYVRRSNEDAILAGDWIGRGESASHAFDWVVDGHGLLLAVADGLGGHRAGEVASRFVVEELSRRAETGCLVQEEGFADLLKDIDADLRGMARSAPSLQGMGSTLAAAFVAVDGLVVANVGDSRVYVYDDKDGLRQVSVDHVPRAVPKEGQPVGARRTTHAITQAFGGSVSRPRPLRPTILQIPGSQHGSSLLLCSDGLTDLIDDSGLTETLASRRMGADDLVRQALDAGGIDNVSAIVARFEA